MHPEIMPLIPSLAADVDGITINYTAKILPGSRFTLVLIHGFGATLETWSDIYPLLTDKYSVVRVDLKGAGFSSKPKDSHYSPTDQARILTHFIRKVGLTNVVLVGHSLGGGIALVTHFELTDSGQDSPKGLVLIDSAGYLQKLPFFVAAVRNPITRIISDLMPPDVRACYVLRRIFRVKERITPDRVHRYAFFLDRPGSRCALRQTARQILSSDVETLASRLPTMTVPTLILWGENDSVIPLNNAYRFQTDIHNSQLVVLSDTGHMPQEERPVETFEAMDNFLRRLK